MTQWFDDIYPALRMSSRFARLILALVLVALATACSGDEPPAGKDAAGPGSDVVVDAPDGRTDCDAGSCACLQDSDCSSGICLLGRNGARSCGVVCTTDEECATGDRCTLVGSHRVCRDPGLYWCDPCSTDTDCYAPGGLGAACLNWQGEQRCGVACATDTDCPAGAACQLVPTVSGSSKLQCVPVVDGSPAQCSCSVRASQLGLTMPCLSGVACTGQRTCTSTGLSACDAPEASAEVCNGLDDDCNGATDEGPLCTDGNPCTPDQCDGAAGCSSLDPIIACDDDNPCTVDSCDPTLGCQNLEQADCVGLLPYTQDFSCAASPPLFLSDPQLGQPRWGLDALPGLGIGAPGYHSAGCSLNLNLHTGLGCATPGQPATATATTPWLDASAVPDLHHLSAEFWLGGDWPAADVVRLYGQAEAGDGGQNGQWLELAQLSSPGGAWQRVRVDLPAFAGMAFRLQWRWTTASCGLSPNLPGVYLDDLSVANRICKSAADCDDGDPCTNNSCATALSRCVYAPASGAACDDGSPCTLSDTCKSGQCKGSPASKVPCDDANLCTALDTCVAGQCKGSPITIPCTDGNLCTSADLCQDGQCLGVPKNCPDNDPCTVSVCDIASGSCGAVADGEGKTCSGGLCANAAACHLGLCHSFGGCDDNNPCTSDSCSGGGSCSFAPLPSGSVCADGLACTTGDTCVAGQCQGQVAACGPAASAPMVCDLPLGASWTTTAVAVDGSAWHVGPSPAVVTAGLTANTDCSLRFAGPAGQLACPATDDGPGALGSAIWRLDLTGVQSAVLTLWSHASFGGAKQPVSRWIDVSTNGFVSVALSHGWAPGIASGVWEPVSLDLSALVGQVVDVRFRLDASLCQSGGLLIPMGSGWAIRDLVVTSGGKGSACTTAAECGDNNPCTTDLCLASGACSHASTGAACDDGSLCTQGDGCTEQGQCHGSVKLVCKDDSACTADTCDPASGCVFTPLPGGAACSDGDVCTSGDICLSGLCLTKQACDDGNPCTTDTCEPDGDCTQVALPAGTACNDGDPCTVNEQCVVGQCSGSPVPCSAVEAMDLPCDATGWSLGQALGSTLGWQLDNSPVVPTAHSGTCTLHLHDNDGIGCAPGTTLAASATSPVMAVPSSPASVLELWSWADVGVTLQKNARLIEVSSDGFATVAVRRWLDNGKFPRSWQRVRLDLAGLAGQSVQVRLRFDAMACQGDIGLGWLVDDLRLVAAVAQPCAELADCQPADACIEARCRAGACEYMPATTGCDDGNLCTVADVCAHGQCSGSAKFCDDGLPCTLDTCDAVDGCVAGIRPNGALCDDKNSCTSATTCQNGNCLGFVAPNSTPCSSSTPCVEAQVCTQGKCTGGKPTVAGSGCDDGNPCTPPGTCGTTGCIWPAGTCDDGEPCTLDSCHPLGGSDSACQHLVLPLDSPCDDGDPCTQQDSCMLGGCDGPLTTAGCFIQFGSDFDDCQWPADWTASAPVLGVAWGIDGLPAWPGSRSGTCSLNFNNNKDFSAGNSVAGEVALPPIAVPLLGVTDLVLWSWHAGWLEEGVDKRSILIRTAPTGPLALEMPLANASRPGQWQRIELSLLPFVGKTLWIRLRMDSVTAVENAAPGWFVDDLRVQVRQPPDCKKNADCAAPAEPCQVASCEASTCVAKVLTGSCDDGQICTGGDDCSSGKCKGTAVNCDDGYACTVDTCQNPTGCQHAVLAGCGIVAVPYTEPFDCNSSGPTYWLRQIQTQNLGLGGPEWQVDASPEAPGYASASCSLNFNNGQNFTCPDGASSVGGTATTPVLDASGIAPGKLLRVRFKLAGTWDVGTADDVQLEIKPMTGQTWQLLESWDPAPGWRTITVDLASYAGTSFQLRFAFATTDCGSNAGSGPFVDDFQVFGGNCTSDQTCEDGNSCTKDSCQIATGLCSAQAISGKCDDGNACTLNDACSAGDCAGAAVACNDDNPCTDDACSPVNGTCQNAAKVDGAGCNDNLQCTTGDTCTAGNCSGATKPVGSTCQDGNSCTTGDQCIGSACTGTGVAVPGSLCSDGDPCTAGETCNGAVCGGAQPACDDGDPCTLDQCTAVGPLSKTCKYQPISGCQP